MSSETDAAVEKTPQAVLPYRDGFESATLCEFLERNLTKLEELAARAEYDFTHEGQHSLEDQRDEAIQRRAQAALIRDLLTFL